jgi:F-type H+-transporting ATPase subunit delta
MQGSSRGAAVAGLSALESALRGGADATAMAEDLFAAVAAIDGNATLRRALADPSRESDAKRGLVTTLFGGKVGDGAVAVLGELAAQRWSGERDLTDTLESLGVQALLANAEQRSRLDTVEDELFRFERTVTGNPELRDAVTNRYGDGDGQVRLVGTLLDGRSAPETKRLAEQAVRAPRGRRFDRTVGEYLELAAERRDRLTATVTTAVPLSEGEQGRLVDALTRIYEKPIQLQVIHDPSVIGGLMVHVGDEVIDGTIARKLDTARRHLA